MPKKLLSRFDIDSTPPQNCGEPMAEAMEPDPLRNSDPL
jgi:hypothetical protein